MINLCNVSRGVPWGPRRMERIYMAILPKKTVDNNKYCLDYLKRCISTMDICKALNEFQDEELLSPDKIEALAHRYNCIYDSDLCSFVPSSNFYAFDFHSDMLFYWGIRANP